MENDQGHSLPRRHTAINNLLKTWLCSSGTNVKERSSYHTCNSNMYTDKYVYISTF